MKNIYFALFLSCLVVLSSSSMLRNSKKDSEGVASNHDESLNKDALVFSLGSHGGYVLKNEGGYKVPEISTTIDQDIQKFNEEQALKKVVDTPEETPSNKFYYNGDQHLSVVKLECNTYHSQDSCKKIEHCGWCTSSSTCVEGSARGPHKASDCESGKFFYI